MSAFENNGNYHVSFLPCMEIAEQVVERGKTMLLTDAKYKDTSQTGGSCKIKHFYTVKRILIQHGVPHL